MAFPGETSGTYDAPSAKFVELSHDELERLAMAFRPSWELDDAAFSSTPPFSAEDARALQRGGVEQEVRDAKLGVSAFRGGDGASASRDQQPLEKARSDEEGTAQNPRSRPASTPPNASFTDRLSPRTPAALGLSATRAAGRTEPPLSSISVEGHLFRRRSGKPLWLGIGVAALAACLLGLWAAAVNEPPASSSLTAREPAAPRTQAAESATTPPASVAPPSPPVPISPPPLFGSLPPTEASVAPAPPAAPAVPPPGRTGVTSPLRAVGAGAAPRPATKPRPSAPTIVRDVPF